MNFGLFRGFTWQAPATGASFPEMKVLYVPYTVPSRVFGANGLDTLVLVDTSSTVTVELEGQGLKEGQCIHFAQWGSELLTLTNDDGLLRYASGLANTTRAQYSVITAMFINSTLNEWLLFGDLASS